VTRHLADLQAEFVIQANVTGARSSLEHALDVTALL
jgi:hypothetical protein